MDLREIIQAIRAEFTDLNPPAGAEDLSELERLFGGLPEQVLMLYRDHNGSNGIPHLNGRRLAARLMPIREVLKIQTAMAALSDRLPTVAPVMWLWADDNSNYCGVFTEGTLSGSLCAFNHDEPMLTPAFRSITSFMSRLLIEVRSLSQSGVCDIPSVPREIPELEPNEVNRRHDMELAQHFRDQYVNESSEGLRRLYAFCSVCLTPFKDTDNVTLFLEDRDMWIPEAAVHLLELRQWKGSTELLEKLAQEGRPNGDAAAIRLLARMDTSDSRQAIERLRQTLRGQKLKVLEMWTDPRRLILPASW